ncbi:unnamed protein product, partial [Ectocarpus sp. 12 AP-2014]
LLGPQAPPRQGCGQRRTVADRRALRQSRRGVQDGPRVLHRGRRRQRHLRRQPGPRAHAGPPDPGGRARQKEQHLVRQGPDQRTQLARGRRARRVPRDRLEALRHRGVLVRVLIPPPRILAVPWFMCSERLPHLSHVRRPP